MRTFKNDQGEEMHATLLSTKELALLSSLVTTHIKTLEGLMPEGKPGLPSHKQWMYILEDKL